MEWDIDDDELMMNSVFVTTTDIPKFYPVAKLR